MHQEDVANRSAGSPKAGCCGKDGGQSGGKALVPAFLASPTRHQLCSPEFAKLSKKWVSPHPQNRESQFNEALLPIILINTDLVKLVQHHHMVDAE